MLAPVLVDPPETAPVSLDEAKAQLRISHDDEDDYIEALIAAAVAYLDGGSGILGRCLITQTWLQGYPGWPGACEGQSYGWELQLPFCDVAAAGLEVAYTDVDEVDHVLDPSTYRLNHNGVGGFLWFRRAFTFPSLSYDRPDPVRVTFAAGFGDDAEDVPAPIKHAIKLLLSHWYENREATIVGIGRVSADKIPLAVDALIEPYRRVGV